jgi:hypothetical protein
MIATLSGRKMAVMVVSTIRVPHAGSLGCAGRRKAGIPYSFRENVS